MRTTKEAELTIAIFRYIAQCLDEGDLAALTHLGLNRADAEAVGALALADLDPLAASRFPLLKPEAVNRTLVHRLVAHAKTQRTLKGVRDALLCRDAPLPMMRQLFGMDSSEYAERGRALGVVRLLGRPSAPTEEQEARVWKVYCTLGKVPGCDLTPEEYLRLHTATEVPLRTLWVLVRRWVNDAQGLALFPVGKLSSQRAADRSHPKTG